jgi:protein-tyrosine phosphatase
VATVLVVDGADVCRAPIVEFTLRQSFKDAAWLRQVRVISRGLEARPGTTMCETAADRLGFTATVVGFYVSHRAAELQPGDVAGADLILTAERDQRAAVARLVPGSQQRIFTLKEARVLATMLTERVHGGQLPPPSDLPTLVGALHAARGAIPVIEPPVKTNAFHWRRAGAQDPLSIADGHDVASLHRHVVNECWSSALAFGGHLADTVQFDLTMVRPPDPARLHWPRRA